LSCDVKINFLKLVLTTPSPFPCKWCKKFGAGIKGKHARRFLSWSSVAIIYSSQQLLDSSSLGAYVMHVGVLNVFEDGAHPPTQYVVARNEEI
jgi:hypothetical protein